LNVTIPPACNCQRSKAQVIWFSRKKEVSAELVSLMPYVFRDLGPAGMMLVSEVPSSAHNVENVLAAVCVGMLLDCKPIVFVKLYAISSG